MPQLLDVTHRFSARNHGVRQPLLGSAPAGETNTSPGELGFEPLDSLRDEVRGCCCDGEHHARDAGADHAALLAFRGQLAAEHHLARQLIIDFGGGAALYPLVLDVDVHLQHVRVQLLRRIHLQVLMPVNDDAARGLRSSARLNSVERGNVRPAGVNLSMGKIAW